MPHSRRNISQNKRRRAGGKAENGLGKPNGSPTLKGLTRRQQGLKRTFSRGKNSGKNKKQLCGTPQTQEELKDMYAQYRKKQLCGRLKPSPGKGSYALISNHRACRSPNQRPMLIVPLFQSSRFWNASSRVCPLLIVTLSLISDHSKPLTAL